MIYIRPMQRQTIICRNCTDREPDCGEICRGQWCHEDSTAGAAGCGYGPPSLPYFYKGPELLYYRTRMCVTVSRGSSSPRKYCICNTNNCNIIYKRSMPWNNHLEGTTRIRSLFLNSKENDIPVALHKCVNCEISTQDIRMIASCKQNQCIGHYCTYATQRLYIGIKQYRTQKSILNERQGCINVTDNHHIQLGCSHKWMSNEEEELHCACIGDRCNRDLAIASLNNAIRLTVIITEHITVIFICLIIYPNLLF
ncbi:hypothetical protein LOAG_08040 [Loa loa]|uniref:Uncharacterized protein n=2 Tax=Loa loa TaxID=7209 RepID=A0A1S0TUI4_LOALO|nr:hypothetical protein LOAG_08040 [Loa loa]EFO20451.1 hypothetical protein LOAG_08040 [Loa loa]